MSIQPEQGTPRRLTAVRVIKYTSQAILLAAGCFVAYLLGLMAADARSGRVVEPVANPPRVVNGLVVEPAALNLGELWETPEHVAPLTIRNVSVGTVAITAFAPSCECTGVEPKAVTIGPGESAQVSVKIDLTHRLPYQIGVASRPLSVRLDPVFAGNAAPLPGWELIGTVHSRVSFNTPLLQFGDSCVSGEKAISRKVRVTAHVPIESVEATAPAEYAVVQVEPVAGTPGRYDIVVRPNPNLPVGPFRFDVATHVRTPDGRRHPGAAIAVHGDMQSPTRILPDTVLLGEHPVGRTAEATVTVRLPAGGGWSVEHVETDSPDTAVKVVGSGVGPLRYRIVQTISRPRDQTCPVRFVVRRPDGTTESVTVNVSYYGESSRTGDGKEVMP